MAVALLGLAMAAHLLHVGVHGSPACFLQAPRGEVSFLSLASRASVCPRVQARGNIVAQKYGKARIGSSGRQAMKALGLSMAGSMQKSEIKDFLTQRALQNLLFILGDLGRDDITANWLERWNGHDGLKKYHGFRGLKMDWHCYLSTLIRTPPEKMVVEFKRRGAGVGGWSKDNPYLQNHVYEYEVTVEPKVLAERMMKLREEISNEWREDLMLFDKESNEIWRGYLERVREKEDKNAHMQFPVFAHDVSDSNCGTNYRGGNYDLLKRLSTFLAIKKFIAEKKRGNKNEQTSADWLDRMLMVHGTDFEGDAGYDVDRNFMQMLLNQSPSFVRNANDESLALVDPVAVVEQLLESRCEIAKTWCKELEDVPSDHTEIARKLLLEQLKD